MHACHCQCYFNTVSDLNELGRLQNQVMSFFSIPSLPIFEDIDLRCLNQASSCLMDDCFFDWWHLVWAWRFYFCHLWLYHWLGLCCLWVCPSWQTSVGLWFKLCGWLWIMVASLVALSICQLLLKEEPPTWTKVLLGTHTPTVITVIISCQDSHLLIELKLW